MTKGPEHYTRLSPEPLEVIRKWRLNYPLASALKYIARAGFKEGALFEDDINKAISFLKEAIDWGKDETNLR